MTGKSALAKAIKKKKMGKVMHEWGTGKLHSGSPNGPVVTNQKQAIAIGISEGERALKKRRGAR